MTVEVAIALVWKDGRLLVTRRPAGVHLGGLWEFPGGKMRPGESAERCAEREVNEETGVRCRAERVRATIRHTYPERSVVLHPVDCAWIAGEPRAREVEAVLWLLPRELAEYAFPRANSALLEELTRS
jgi:mutator protein MutT